MERGEDARVGALIARLVDRSAARPAVTLAIALALTLLAGWIAATRLGVNANTDDLFDAHLPFRQLDLEAARALPLRENNLLVVIDAPTAGAASRAALELAERARAETALFDGALVPGDGAYFRRNGLLFLDVDQLEELADELSGVQPFLAGLARDPSLRGFFGLLDQAVRGALEGQGAGFDLVPVFEKVRVALAAGDRLGGPEIPIGELMPGRDDAPRRYVLLHPRIDYGELLHVEKAMDWLRASFAAQHFPERGIRVRVTGDRVLEVEEFTHVEAQATWAGAASLLLVSAILWYALRSGRHIAAVLAALVVGLVVTAAFAALAVGHINVISIAFAVLFIGLGVDFGTHFCLHYRELRAGGQDHPAALDGTARSVGASLALCALTTAVGFLAFVPTGFAGVAELGLISGVGMAISLVASLTVLPACLSLGPGAAAPLSGGDPGARIRLPSWPLRHPAAATALAGLAALAGLLLLPELRFDGNPLRVRDPSAPSVQAFFELLDSGDLNPWSVEVLTGNLAEADALAARLARLPEVDSAITLSSYVPGQQPEKLRMLGEMSLLLGLADATPRPPPTQAESLAAIGTLVARLRELGAQADEETLAAEATRLAGELQRFADAARENPRALEAFRLSVVAPLVEDVDQLRDALAAGPVGLDDVPRALRDRMVAPDGRAIVEVRPKGTLNDDATLTRYVEAVQAVSPRATGDAVFQEQAAATVVGALNQAMGYSIPTIALLLLVLWRSLRDTALVVGVLLLAALLTAAACVVIGLPINFANVIVIPLLLGIGVDSGIHLVHRYRETEGDPADLMASSTSRAVLWSSVTTIASFASLGFASHRGLASLGQLLTLGVVITLACNLLVLPALLELMERRRRARAG